MKIRSLVFPVVSALIFFSLFACQTMAVKAQAPVIDPKATAETKTNTYNQYSLKFNGHVFWGYYFTQGTNKTQYLSDGAKDIMVSMSPAAAKSLNDGDTSTTIANIFALGGGGCLGFAFGDMIGSGHAHSYSLPLMLGGGGGILVSIVFSMFATDGYIKAASEYNGALKNKLGLTNAPAKVTFNFIPDVRYDAVSRDLSLNANLVTIAF